MKIYVMFFYFALHYNTVYAQTLDKVSCGGMDILSNQNQICEKLKVQIKSLYKERDNLTKLRSIQSAIEENKVNDINIKINYEINSFWKKGCLGMRPSADTMYDGGFCFV